MAIKLTHYQTIREYFRALTSKAKHHAPNVVHALLLVAYQVLMRADRLSGIDVRQHTEMRYKDAAKRGSTRLGNIAFFFVKGVRYTLRYLHNKQAIALSRGSSRAKPTALFDNSSTSAQVEAVFRAL